MKSKRGKQTKRNKFMIVSILVLIIAITSVVFVNKNNTLKIAKLNNKKNISAQNQDYYVINLNQNGGTGGTEKVYLTENNELYFDKSLSNKLTHINIPTKTGYVFAGYVWYANQSTSGDHMFNYDGELVGKKLKTYIDAQGLESGDTVTLTAAWESVENKYYVINLDKNEGTGGTDTVYLAVNNEVYADKNMTTLLDKIDVPTRIGYDFSGYVWYDNQSTSGDHMFHTNGILVGSKLIDAIKDLKLKYKTEITLKAAWEPNGKGYYKINLDKNDGTGGTDIIYLSPNNYLYANKGLTEEIDKIPELPTRVGYNFSGYVWLDNPNTSGSHMFHTNGTIVGSKLIDAIDNLGLNYGEEITLRAAWIKNGKGYYKINLDKNEGTGGTDTVYLSPNNYLYSNKGLTNEIDKIPELPTREGYDFSGYMWYDNQSTSGNHMFHTNGTPVGSKLIDAIDNLGLDYGEEITLRAAWVENGKGYYKINLDKNEGTGGTDTVYLTSTNKLYLDESLTNEVERIPESPTREGYDFAGYVWYDNQSTSGNHMFHTNGTPVGTKLIDAIKNLWLDFGDEITLKAAWVENGTGYYKINLDKNDGEGGTDIIYLTSTNKLYLDENLTNEVQEIPELPTREGYDFSGYVWYDNQSTSGNHMFHTNGTLVGTKLIDAIKNLWLDFGDEITLKAAWDKVQTQTYDYKITLNLNGGNINGNTNNIVLYVKKEDGIYKDQECTNKYEVTDNTIQVSAPTKEGYIFKGYAGGTNLSNVEGYITHEDGKIISEVYNNMLTTNSKEDQEFNAMWSEEQKEQKQEYDYKIILDSNGGNGANKTLYVIKEDGIYTDSNCQNKYQLDSNGKITISNLPTKEGYIFAGYAENKDGDGLQIDKNGISASGTYEYWIHSYNEEDNLTYYAIWTKNSPIENEIKISVIGNATEWTNSNVNLEIIVDKDENIELDEKPYSFDGGKTWQAENLKTYTENTSGIKVMVKDSNGNITTYEETIDIDRIDKEKPSLKINAKDNKLEITVNDNASGIKNVLVNGKKIEKDEDGKYYAELSSIGEYKVQVFDNAGNESTETYTYKETEESTTDTTTNSAKTDTTTSTKVIPQTGKKLGIIGAIILTIGIGLYSRIRYKGIKLK